jgi:hypothetical protein
MPQGSSITPFVYTTAVQDGGVGSLTFDVNGLFACPVSGSDGVYQVFFNMPFRLTQNNM